MKLLKNVDAKRSPFNATYQPLMQNDHHSMQRMRRLSSAVRESVANLGKLAKWRRTASAKLSRSAARASGMLAKLHIDRQA